MPLSTIEERILHFVRICPSRCWEWAGGRTRGYGKTRRDGKDILAHRAVYEFFVGPIPAGLELHHECHNNACVNPSHLRPVTHKENMHLGYGPSYLNTLKTHCPQGHPYAGSNLRHKWKDGGDRVCRTCDRARKHALYTRPANKDKTHCPKGHEYTPENTEYTDRGRGWKSRHCKQCHRERERRRQASLRAQGRAESAREVA